MRKTNSDNHPDQRQHCNDFLYTFLDAEATNMQIYRYIDPHPDEFSAHCLENTAEFISAVACEARSPPKQAGCYRRLCHV